MGKAARLPAHWRLGWKNQIQEITDMNDISEILDSIRRNDMAAYCDGRMAFIDSSRNLGSVGSVGRVSTDALILSLCLNGNLTVAINDRECTIGPGDLMVCMPGTTIDRRQVPGGIEGRCICLSTGCMRRLSQINMGDAWNAIVALQSSPVLRLRPDEVQVFCNYYDLMLSRLNSSGHRYQEKLVESLLMAFLYDFHGLLERFFTPSSKPRRSADKVFSDFVSLLSSASPRPRDVAYYADRLCLTPKYLSAVCKQVSGITASQFIAQFVVKDICRLLDETDKSIKEVCNELAFPNPSFFGTYVRKHLGLSPRRYRDRGK